MNMNFLSVISRYLSARHTHTGLLSAVSRLFFFLSSSLFIHNSLALEPKASLLTNHVCFFVCRVEIRPIP